MAGWNADGYRIADGIGVVRFEWNIPDGGKRFFDRSDGGRFFADLVDLFHNQRGESDSIGSR